MAFKNIYKSTREHIKLQFLDAIIEHNEKLQQEFLAFARNQEAESEKQSYGSFLALVNDVQTTYQGDFESVDTENPDWDNYTPSHSGYIEEWEQYQQASEQEFQEIFQFFVSAALDKIILQRPDELLAMLVGLYEAAMDAEVPDEFGSFDDVNEFLLSEHRQVMERIVQKMRLSAVADSKINAAFELFFRYCNEKHPGNQYFAKHFEHILLALAEKTGDAGRLLTMMEEAGLEQKNLPELSLLLLKSGGNQESWLQSARKLYRHSEPVARELLKYYFEKDQVAFVKTARELFPANPSAWAGFLKDYITPELDKSLFVKVFSKLLLLEENIAHYQKAKPYLDKAAYNTIIGELLWNKAFLVKVLAEDERYADIRAIVEKENDRWHFEEIIAPILKVYPDFCFAKIKAMVDNTLANERGRSVYKRIAKWLLLARQIPGHESNAMYLIKNTYNHKPNLPALKDEMRDAGLMGG